MGKLNPYQLVRLIHSFGVQNKQIDPVVSLCLGPGEISVGEMVSAYSAFANRGIRTAPVFVLDGTLAENIALGCRSIDKERVAEIVRLVRLDAWIDDLKIRGNWGRLGNASIGDWDYYSERCLEYLTGGNMKKVMVFRWIYILAVFIGPYMTVSAVWTIADIFNGLMALPNMIALFALNGVVVYETKKFFEAGKHKK